MTAMRLLGSATASGLLALGLAACGGDGEDTATVPPGGGVTIDKIDVKDFAFKPENATVKAGTKVTWTFSDNADHNIEPVGGTEPTKSPDLKDGATHSVTFATPGTFKYRCGIHNYMTGTVTVTA